MLSGKQLYKLLFLINTVANRHRLADQRIRKTMERGDFRLLHYAGEVTYCVVGESGHAVACRQISITHMGQHRNSCEAFALFYSIFSFVAATFWGTSAVGQLVYC